MSTDTAQNCITVSRYVAQCWANPGQTAITPQIYCEGCATTDTIYLNPPYGFPLYTTGTFISNPFCNQSGTYMTISTNKGGVTPPGNATIRFDGTDQTTGAYIAASLQIQLCVGAPKVNLYLGDPASSGGAVLVTNTTKKISVGQKVTLSGVLSGNCVQAPAENPSWTVPGAINTSTPLAIKNWTGSISTGTLTPLTSSDLSNKSRVDFYWVAPVYPLTVSGQQTVSHTISNNGINYTGIVTFDIKRPSATLTSTTRSPTIDNYYEVRAGSTACTVIFAFHLGSSCNPSGGTPNVGISFNASNVTTDVDYGTSKGAVFQWVQVVSVNDTITYSDNTTKRQSTSVPVLDTFYPYEGNVTSTSDAPYVGLTSNLNQVVQAEAFSMWFMYKPPGGSASIWVPVARIDWGWSGIANRNTSTGLWTLSSPFKYNNAAVNTLFYPTWTQNITSVTYK